MADREKIYFLFYDVADSKRWRNLYQTLQGYGEWVQLSVFQCSLTKTRYAQLVTKCQEIINHKEDHLVIIEVGSAKTLKPKIRSIGKRTVDPIEREVIIL